MRRVVAIALATFALAFAPQEQPGRRGVSYSPLGANGIDDSQAVAATLPGGVPAPDVQWWASDPTGSGSITSTAFTANGAPSASETPYCPAGDHSDLTNCIAGRFFSGATNYASDTASVLDLNAHDEMTVCALFNSTTSGSVVGVAGSRNAGNNEGWYMSRSAGDNFFCWADNDTQTANSAVSSSTGWAFGCCVIDQGTDLTAYYNGTADGTPGAFAAGTAAASSGLGIAAVTSAGASRLTGDIVFVFGWHSLLTATQITSLTNAVLGQLTTDGNTITSTRTTQGAASQDSGARVEIFGMGAPLVGDNGLSLWDQIVNYSSDSLDWSAHTDVGTPTNCMAGTPANCDSESGPLSTFNGGAEADTIGDDDGAAYEGGRMRADTTYTGAYTAWAYVKDGTETGATIDIQTDGTGSKTCTFSGLDALDTATTSGGSILCALNAACDGTNGFGPNADFAKIICSTTIGGVPSATTADLLIGDAAADTGTIVASMGQVERAGYAGRDCPEMAGGASATCDADTTDLPTTNWPVNHGCVSFDYWPEVSSAPWANQYFFDSATRGTGEGLIVRRSTGNVLVGLLYGAGGLGATASSAGLTWTVNTQYRIKACWSSTALEIYRNETLVASDTTVTDIPTQHTSGRLGYSHDTLDARPNGRVGNVQVRP